MHKGVWWFFFFSLWVLLVGVSFQGGSFDRDTRFSPKFQQQEFIDNSQLIGFDEGSQSNGYIVLLKNPSVVEEKIRLEKTRSFSKIALEESRNRLRQEQAFFESKFDSISSRGEVTGKVEDVLNAVFITGVTDNELEELKRLGEVKEVFPNHRVSFSLIESIPLISADEIWGLNDVGGQCGLARCGELRPIIGAGGFGRGVTGSAIAGSRQLIRPGDEQPVLCQAPPEGYEYEIIPATECLTGEGVTIGIIDTGVDYTHPDLGGCFGSGCKVIGGWDFGDNDADPMDDLGHGTHVAATAAGNGVFKGIAPDADVYAYKVSGQGGLSWEDRVIAAIDRSVDPNQDWDFSDHLDIISLSLGVDHNPDGPTALAADNAVNMGVVVVAAVGNGFGIFSPASARKAIGVGAVDKQLNMASFSSRDPVIWVDGTGTELALVKPDVVAPGVDICAAKWAGATNPTFINGCFDNNHITLSGTSMATPHVSGLAALVIQRNPDYTPGEIKSVIRNTASLLPNPEKVTTQGLGLVDAKQAVFFNNPLIVSLNPIVQDASQVDISGKIEGNNFDHYELAYSLGNVPISTLNEDDWDLMIDSSNIIPSNVLFYQGFDLASIPAVEFLIRVRAFDTSGRIFEDYGYIGFEKLSIIQPIEGSIFNPGEDLIIEVSNPFNLPIDDMVVEYSGSFGPIAIDWTSQGVVADVPTLRAKILAGTFTDNGVINLRITLSFNGLSDQIFVEDISVDNNS